jgi:hypothetical protein
MHCLYKLRFAFACQRYLLWWSIDMYSMYIFTIVKIDLTAVTWHLQFQILQSPVKQFEVYYSLFQIDNAK